MTSLQLIDFFTGQQEEPENQQDPCESQQGSLLNRIKVEPFDLPDALRDISTRRKNGVGEDYGEDHRDVCDTHKDVFMNIKKEETFDSPGPFGGISTNSDVQLNIKEEEIMAPPQPLEHLYSGESRKSNMSAINNAGALSAYSADLVTKYKSSSIVWRYFGFRKEDLNQRQVLCRYCLAVIATKHGNTTNMFHHLRKHHRVIYEECIALRKMSANSQSSSQVEPKQSLVDAHSIVTPYESTSPRYKEITDAITYYIAKDMVPVYTVSKEGFQKMVLKLDRRYKIPSQAYFNRVAIPELYNECKTNVESELREIDHFATTMDLWWSRMTDPYISLTVHFITPNFELKTRCLQTSYFPGEQTGENVAYDVRIALVDWDLKEDHQVCVTTNDASNMMEALELTGWTRLQCFGHWLHLAIENAVKSDNRISHATGVCKKLVCHFSHSSKKRVALEQAQKRLNLPAHGLIAECESRWGSTVLMIDRILEQQEALSAVLSEDTSTEHLDLGNQDLDVLESVSKALSPLLEFTDALSAEGYVSVSHIKPVLSLFNSTILAPKEGDTDMTKSLKGKMLEYMNRKYEDRDTQELLDVVSFLDPRYKAQYISVNDIPIIKARLVSEIKTMEHKNSTECSIVEEASPPPTKKAKKSLASFFKRSAAGVKEPLDSTVVVQAELNAYMHASTIDSEDNPFVWWRTHKIHFPRLSKLARKYLCMQATSCPLERIFSTSGNIVSCERSCLMPGMVNKLVFLEKNL